MAWALESLKLTCAAKTEKHWTQPDNLGYDVLQLIGKKCDLFWHQTRGEITQNRWNMIIAVGFGRRRIHTTPTILFAPRFRVKAELQAVLCVLLAVGGVIEPDVPLHNYNLCSLPVAVSGSGSDGRTVPPQNILALQILQLLLLRSLPRKSGLRAFCQRSGGHSLYLCYPPALPTLTPTLRSSADKSD